MKCYEVIKGICEGLYYLHVKQRIVHLDLKPANILLNNNIVPNIADVGLQRCFDKKQCRAFTSKLNGTPGYMTPEFSLEKLYFKSDIYSLGVIIIHILTGKKGHGDV
jgi:serine/threonine protein kinase